MPTIAADLAAAGCSRSILIIRSVPMLPEPMTATLARCHRAVSANTARDLARAR